MKKRKDGRFQIAKTIDGKRKYFYGDTRVEAYEKLQAYEKDKSRPRTFGEIAGAWQDEYWDGFAPGTRNCYRSSLARALDAFGKESADDVEPMEIQALLETLKRQNYSLKAVKTQKTVVSTIYKYGMLRGMCRTNPATVTKIPKGLSKELRLPPDDETIKKIKADREWLYPQILLYTGCRRGEALALTYEDFDFEKGTVNIDKEIIFESNEPRLVHRTKTHAGKRTVPLVKALREQIPENKTGAVFDDITLRRFKTLWDKYCKRLEIEVTPHQLRHAYATMLYDAGVDVKIAQRLLGHSSLKMTMDIYTHIRESRLDDVAEQLNSFLNS